jgi:hypothetical protein
MTYSKDWFGKTITNSEVMDEKFNVMLRYPKVKGTGDLDYSRAPTLSVKIPCWSGVWKTEVYDEDGIPLFLHGKTTEVLDPLDFLKSKTRVICLIQCGGLWFVNGKVSITWNLKQVVVQKPTVSLEGTCFIKPKASEIEALKSGQTEERSVTDDEYVTAKVEDSEDEEDDEQAPVKMEAVDECEELDEGEEDDTDVVLSEKEQTPPPTPAPEKKKRVVKKK